MLYNRKLKKSIKNIIETIPFYNRLKTEDYSDFESLFLDIPVIDKKIHRENTDLLLSNSIDCRKINFEFTSGSTGEPFVCRKSIYDKLAISNSLTFARKNFFKKFNVNDKLLRFYGSWTPYNYENNSLLLSVFYNSKDIIKEYCEKIAEYNPQWIFGTPSSIYNFVKLVKKYNLVKYLIGNSSIKYIETTGEFLSISVKDFLEEFFSCRIVNHYGCREIWHIGLSCEYNKFHIIDDNAFVEIIGENGLPLQNGENGEIVITGLNNISIPFLRYKIGDIGCLNKEECKCSNKSTILTIVGGRVSEYIQLSDGTQISSVFIHHLFRKIEINGYKGIDKYYVQQDDIYGIKIYLLVNMLYSRDSEKIIFTLCKKIFGDMLSVKLYYCDLLPVNQNGKHKTFVSNVNNSQKGVGKNTIPNNNF